MKILVLCTGNSARSQIAEGLLRTKIGQKPIDVVSAGTSPKGLNPLAVEVMNEIGIDISHHQSKDVASFSDQKFDVVITVCDRARQNCPVFFGAKTIHWDIPDPETIEDFRSVRDDLRKRIDPFLTDLN